MLIVRILMAAAVLRVIADTSKESTLEHAINLKQALKRWMC